MSDRGDESPDNPRHPGYLDNLADRADERRKNPDVVLDRDGAAIGINWKREVA